MVIPGSWVLWSVHVSFARRWISVMPCSRSREKSIAGVCRRSDAIGEARSIDSCLPPTLSGDHAGQVLHLAREILDGVDQHGNQARVRDAQVILAPLGIY